MHSYLQVVRIEAAADGAADLPDGAPEWLPLAVFWPNLDESAYLRLRAGFDAVEPGWSEFVRWSTRLGVMTAAAEASPPALQVNPSWLPRMESAVHRLMDEPESRAKAVAACRPDNDWQAAIAFATWARHCGRWETLQALWLGYVEPAVEVPGEMLPLFADLPTEARRSAPLLTWVSAVAEAETISPRSRRTQAFLDRVLLDSAMLHADWVTREDTDTAVLAGILRMVGERYLPPSGGPLEAAWRTKVELDAFVDARSRAGRPPRPQVHALLRLMSGRLAIMRADLRAAVAEAHWGGVLGGDPGAVRFAGAIESLARSLAGLVSEPDDVRHKIVRPPADHRFGSLSQMAAVMAGLGRGRECLQLLDQAGAERALAEVSTELAGVAGAWASRAGLEAMCAGIWGAPSQGLNRLLAAIADQPVGAREQDEPMGGLMLGRARSFLLCQLGAFEAAIASANAIQDRLRALPQARTLLWAGRFGPAVRAMDMALPDPDLLHSDRLQLLMIKGAATVLDGSITADIAGDTIMAVRQLLLDRSYLSFATLPTVARTAVLDLAGSLANDPETSQRYAELVERLSLIAGAGTPTVLVQLTEREAALLPLLARDDSIPNLARELHVSVNTLRKQVAVLREKFQASTRAELVRKAGSYGALRDD
jgi:Response regulator containing a CheY-like receiver domain and an HTH DNA-binding domain